MSRKILKGGGRAQGAVRAQGAGRALISKNNGMSCTGNKVAKQGEYVYFTRGGRVLPPGDAHFGMVELVLIQDKANRDTWKI